LQADLAHALKLPVFIANDADCFILAEAIQGAGSGYRNVFGIILGTGVGGALVIDGRLVTGAGGFAGEWGHGTALQTEIGNPPVHFPHFSCGCGQKGCVDSVGGAKGMERIHHTLHGEALSSVGIIDSWRTGDPKAIRTIGIWTDLVAPPLSVAINTVGAGIVPVGGGLSGAPDLIAMLDKAVRERILYKSTGPIVVPSRLGGNPAFIGAAILGFQELSHGRHHS
jgi:N-acetylglucosamine kinase